MGTRKSYFVQPLLLKRRTKLHFDARERFMEEVHHAHSSCLPGWLAGFTHTAVSKGAITGALNNQGGMELQDFPYSRSGSAQCS